MYPVMIVIVAELFGAAHIASNYMIFDGMPGAVASLLIAKLLATWSYNRGIADGQTKCYGDDCFRPAYLFIIGLQLAASAASTLLACRSTFLYRCGVFPSSRSETD